MTGEGGRAVATPGGAGTGGTIAAFCPKCKAVLCTVAPDGWFLIKRGGRGGRRYRFRADLVLVTCECGSEWRVEVRRKERVTQ